MAPKWTLRWPQNEPVGPAIFAGKSYKFKKSNKSNKFYNSNKFNTSSNSNKFYKSNKIDQSSKSNKLYKSNKLIRRALRPTAC